MTLRAALILLAVSAALLSAGCGSGDDESSPAPAPGGSGAAAITRDAANARTTITLGTKNFTEQQVLGEVYAQGLEAAGFRVERDFNLGDEQVAFRSVRRRDIDAYPEYTGTALLSLCDVDTADVPKDPRRAYAQTRDCLARDGLTAFPPTPFTSSNEVAVRRETAQQLGLRRISDLARVDQDVTLFGSPECEQRLDCLLGLRRVYGLEFERFRPVDVALRHEVLNRNREDASIVFTTDPQNDREGLVLLEDDRQMFPPYNSTLVVRDDVARAAGPGLPRLLERLQEGLTDRTMRELNARVDLDKETPAQAAGGYLRETGLVTG